MYFQLFHLKDYNEYLSNFMYIFKLIQDWFKRFKIINGILQGFVLQTLYVRKNFLCSNNFVNVHSYDYYKKKNKIKLSRIYLVLIFE